MSQNPIQIFLRTYESLAHAIQTRFSDLFSPYSSRHPNDQNIKPPPVSTLVLQQSSKPTSPAADGPNHLIVQSDGTFIEPPSASKKKSAVPLTKEELGRATWTLLHAIAAQYPDKPSRQQKRDVKELMAIISRLYPCKECSDHFKEILKANPVQAGSHAEFSDWLCHVHNVVNRSVGKLPFPCQRVDARWGKLDCPDRACDVDGSSNI